MIVEIHGVATSERCKNGHPRNAKNTGIKAGQGTVYCKVCASDATYRSNQSCLRVLIANPDHEDHGTEKGYKYGCRCFKCRIAKSVARKRREHGRQLHEGPQ